MVRILILGAGFGGITAALELQNRLSPKHVVTLVEQKSEFLMGLSKLWALDGRRPLEAGKRSFEGLQNRGIQFLQGTVERIQLEEKKVLVSGKILPYDVLVVALGAELDPQAVPGFEHAHNLYDAQHIPRLAKALQEFQKGSILFVIASTPFKCPPAPYEAALITTSLLEKRGVRDRVKLELTTPEPRPLPVVPVLQGEEIKRFLQEKNIQYSPDHKPKAVRSDECRVEYENGAHKSYDLLVGVPTHRAPRVVQQAGLVDGSGWIPVDSKTLSTQFPNVYAIGDVAFVKTPSGKPLPKAGVLAEAQAKVVASNVAAKILGRPPQDSFDGRGNCFIELGDGRATAAEAEFFALPEPRMTMQLPSVEALREKERFESERLQTWFEG